MQRLTEYVQPNEGDESIKSLGHPLGLHPGDESGLYTHGPYDRPSGSVTHSQTGLHLVHMPPQHHQPTGRSVAGGHLAYPQAQDPHVPSKGGYRIMPRLPRIMKVSPGETKVNGEGNQMRSFTLIILDMVSPVRGWPLRGPEG